MKKLILTILYAIALITLTSYNLFAQTIRYVDGSLTGTDNSGESWADAWEDFSQIEWGDLTGGGYLYISGGTDSVVYSSGLTVGTYGASDQYLYIMAGKYSPSPSGHSGRVIIRTSGTGITINATAGELYRDWIYVKGLESRDNNGYGVFLYYDVNNIVIDSCTIIDNVYNGVLMVPASDGGVDTSVNLNNIEIKNCTIVSKLNNNTVDDNILLKGVSNLKIHHNFLWMRNQQFGTGTNHIDNIQCAYGPFDIKIYNNICIVDSGVQGHCMILGVSSSTEDYYDTVFVYNNFMYNGGGDPEKTCYSRQVLYWRGAESPNPGYDPFCIGLNNTIITANGGTFPIVDNYGGGIHANQILAQMGQNCDTPDDCAQGTWVNGGTVYVDSALTNLMWRGYGSGDVSIGGTWVGSGGSPTGNPSNWSGWSTTYGGTGVNDNPDFVYDYCYDDFNDRSFWDYQVAALESTSPAIDAGTDKTYIVEGWFGYLPEMSTNDLLGNPRDIWDIGAFEFQSGWTPPDTTATVTFTPVTDAELNSYHIASGVLSGADSTFHVLTATADSFKVGVLSIFDLDMVEADNGDTVYISNVASNLYETETTSSIVVSGTTRSFSVTTKAEVVEAVIRKVLPGNR